MLNKTIYNYSLIKRIFHNYLKHIYGNNNNNKRFYSFGAIEFLKKAIFYKNFDLKKKNSKINDFIYMITG